MRLSKYPRSRTESKKKVFARTDTRTVSLRVLSPSEQIAPLRSMVNALFAQGAINQGVSNSLLEKLDHALSALEEGRQNVAFNVIGAFDNEVRAKFGEGALLSATELLLL